MAKEKELNFTVSSAIQPEHEQTDDEPQAAVDTGEDHERWAW